MRANLFWRLSDRRWFYELTDKTFGEDEINDRPLGGEDGVEFHGEHRLTLPGATVAENVMDILMVEYEDELHTLYTDDKGRPYIVHGDKKMILRVD